MKKRLTKTSDKNLIDKLDEKCIICKDPLGDDPGNKHETSNGYVCSDCYFSTRGKRTEKHPIGRPGTHHCH